MSSRCIRVRVGADTDQDTRAPTGRIKVTELRAKIR
jgi:hypothetical protein